MGKTNEKINFLFIVVFTLKKLYNLIEDKQYLKMFVLNFKYQPKHTFTVVIRPEFKFPAKISQILAIR